MKIFEGWVIRYGEKSRPMTLAGGQTVREVVAAGAFAASVDAINAGTATIEANVEHADNALSRIGLSGQNVKVENRPEGVYVTVELLADSVSADVFEKMKANVVTDLSCEFQIVHGNDPTYKTEADGSYTRTLSKLTLTGFAVTVAGMYPGAKITAATETRSIAAAQAEAIAAEMANYIKCRRQRCMDYQESHKLIGKWYR